MCLSSLLPPGFRLLSGDDATALAYIAAGGDGCISTVCNVTPDLCRVIFSSLREGRLQTARYLQKRLVPLEACLSRDNPAALKYTLSQLGLITPATRLPLVGLDESAKAAVARAVAGIADEDLVELAQA
jgi:4-hydroxy-tetrahydrodipicolinate synthase